MTRSLIHWTLALTWIVFGCWLCDQKLSPLTKNSFDHLQVVNTQSQSEQNSPSGIPSSADTISAVFADEVVVKKDLSNGQSKSKNSSIASTDLNQLKKQIQSQAIILYFETNSKELIVSREQERVLSSLRYYLDQVAESSISVEGHTDSKGKPEYNKRLSLKRAKLVVDYLNASTKINRNQMNAVGRGQDSPIVSNNSSKNRAKNRRVEIILK